MNMPRFLTIVAMTLTLSLSGFAQSTDKGSKKKTKEDVNAIGERDVGKGINFYSLEEEIALGKKLAEDVERQSRIIDDPVVAEYVNRVGQNLVRNSDAKVPFTFKVIDSQEVNAFALPGGFSFVNTGLILMAQTEGEMAGVLAHEIAHVAARHGTRQASRGQLANIATIPLILMGGWTGYAVRQAAGLAIPLTFLEFSRDFEREADHLGLQYLYKAGYDPTAFVDFFERLASLEKRKPGTLAKVFGSHPLTDDRIGAAQKQIQEGLPPKPEYVVSTSEFTEVKARLTARQLRRKTEEKESDRPSLRRPQTTPVEQTTEEQPSEKKEDERPELKRP